MQHDDKAQKSPKGTIQFLVWSDEAGKLDPAVRAVFRGGNVGHAAIRVVIPQATIDADKNLLKKLDSFKASLGEGVHTVVKDVQENFAINNTITKVPCCEIYFSFWPDDLKPRDFQSPAQDMLAEWSGRASRPLERAKAKEIYNVSDDELDKIVTKTQSQSKRGILDPRRFRKKTESKTVYSGPKEIFHFSPAIIMTQLEDAVKNTNQLIQAQLNQLETLTPTNNDEIDKLNATLLSNDNRLANIAHLKSAVRREDGWSETSLNLLERTVRSYINYLQKEEPDADHLIQEFKREAEKLASTSHRTIGLDADHKTNFGAENFELAHIIDAMQKMSEKKYKFTGWNCSATALFVLMQGLPAPLKQDKEIAHYLKKLSGKHPPIFTPQKVNDIAGMIQVKHLDFLGAQIRAARAEQREKELVEVTRGMHKSTHRPSMFALFQPEPIQDNSNSDRRISHSDPQKKQHP